MWSMVRDSPIIFPASWVDPGWAKRNYYNHYPIIHSKTRESSEIFLSSSKSWVTHWWEEPKLSMITHWCVQQDTIYFYHRFNPRTVLWPKYLPLSFSFKTSCYINSIHPPGSFLLFRCAVNIAILNLWHAIPMGLCWLQVPFKIVTFEKILMNGLEAGRNERKFQHCFRY